MDIKHHHYQGFIHLMESYIYNPRTRKMVKYPIHKNSWLLSKRQRQNTIFDCLGVSTQQVKSFIDK
uniref:Uncharacterized protein n=1 Tax=Anguilla anguilla TaxID=7936 RepID=A0A0E9X5A2_ANGAN